MKNSFSSFLFKSRHRSVNIAPKIEHVIRGSLVWVERVCGKPTCRCAKGSKHLSLYISQSAKGKTRMIYVPERSKKEAIRLVQNYQRLRVAVNRVSEYNIMLLGNLKGHGKRGLKADVAYPRPLKGSLAGLFRNEDGPGGNLHAPCYINSLIVYR